MTIPLELYKDFERCIKCKYFDISTPRDDGSFIVMTCDKHFGEFIRDCQDFEETNTRNCAECSYCTLNRTKLANDKFAYVVACNKYMQLIDDKILEHCVFTESG